MLPACKRSLLRNWLSGLRALRRGVSIALGTTRLHRKRDSVTAIVYTASPSDKDVRATPAEAAAGKVAGELRDHRLLIELPRREDHELLPNLWSQLA